MSQNFINRLKLYYIKVAEVLRGEASASAIFANASDIGVSREKIYAEFLKQHAPSKCNVFLGGFVFDDEGKESKQLDVIITTDTTPRFDFHNANGSGKSFSPVEGTIGVVSIKSTLNKNELIDCLQGIASIPPTRSLDGRVNPSLVVTNYEDWPAKIIYASDGISGDALLAHIKEFYANNPHIPISRRPNFIHVAGKCFIIRAIPGQSILDGGNANELQVGEYYLLTENCDVQAIVWTLEMLQLNATVSTHILYSYQTLFNKVNLI